VAIAQQLPGPTRFDEDVLPRLRTLTETQRAVIFAAWTQILDDTTETDSL
jgi:hypothetical protein